MRIDLLQWEAAPNSSQSLFCVDVNLFCHFVYVFLQGHDDVKIFNLVAEFQSYAPGKERKFWTLRFLMNRSTTKSLSNGETKTLLER